MLDNHCTLDEAYQNTLRQLARSLGFELPKEADTPSFLPKPELDHLIFTFQLDRASASIVVRRSAIIVKGLETPKLARNRGHASRLLTKLCAVADDVDCEIQLVPCPMKDSPLSVQQLIELYKKFNFQGDARLMTRHRHSSRQVET